MILLAFAVFVMGTRGPIPKSNELKLLTGAPGARPGRAKASPAGVVLRCPRWLDDEAREVWHAVVADLKAAGVLGRLDAQSLTCYCQTFARWRKAEEFLRKHGDVIAIKDDAGRVKYLQQVPQVAIARSCLEILTRYQREFGMTPAARARMTIDRDEPQDEFEAFLAQSRRHTPRPTGTTDG